MCPPIRTACHSHLVSFSSNPPVEPYIALQIASAKHRIDLEDGARPVYQPPYRAGHGARAVEKTEIERMLKDGVIEPSSSEWASPVVLVPERTAPSVFV